MKKIVSVMLVLMLTLSLFGTFAFAAESGEGELDQNVVRVYTYDENNGHSPSIWLNTFDYDGNCTGTDYAIFNVAAPMKAIGLPELYAGKSENHADATARFELFNWDTDTEKTFTGVPAFSEEVYFDGDSKVLPYFTFEQPLPAGQYVFRITQLSGVDEEGNKPYTVLPMGDQKFAETKIEFDTRGAFVFYVDFENTDGVTDYFVNLAGKDSDVDVQPEKTVIPRKANGAAYPLFEYGLVTPVIPDGQVLYSISLINAPTWVNKNGDSDVAFEVYKWTGDYEESTAGKILAEGEVFDHADNSDLTLKFGTAMRYGNRYLIVILRSNDGAIGYYEGEGGSADEWEFYEYGNELDYAPGLKVAYANVGDLGPEPTDAPTAAPTEVPPTDVPVDPATDKPADPATDAPADQTTNAPATTKAPEDPGKDNTEKKDNKSNVLPIVIIAVSAVVVIGAVIALIATRKKK